MKAKVCRSTQFPQIYKVISFVANQTLPSTTYHKKDPRATNYAKNISSPFQTHSAVHNPSKNVQFMTGPNLIELSSPAQKYFNYYKLKGNVVFPQVWLPWSGCGYFRKLIPLSAGAAISHNPKMIGCPLAAR